MNNFSSAVGKALIQDSSCNLFLTADDDRASSTREQCEPSPSVKKGINMPRDYLNTISHQDDYSSHIEGRNSPALNSIAKHHSMRFSQNSIGANNNNNNVRNSITEIISAKDQC